jgi:hypothetical protein
MAKEETAVTEAALRAFESCCSDEPEACSGFININSHSLITHHQRARVV